MKKHYKPLSRSEWLSYAKARELYKAGRISHAELAMKKADTVLEDGSLTNDAMAFGPYFFALTCKKNGIKEFTDEVIGETLAKCKKAAEKNGRWRCSTRPTGVEWELFRPHDERYNSYDGITKRMVVPYRMTEEEEKEFEEEHWIHFHDPYCDGRDCTGAPFTSWMKFMRCSDRTIVLHCISYDL